MPATFTNPSLYLLAKTQCYRRWLVFFIEPDAPCPLQQFDGIECCWDLKGFVGEHNAFNALQFACAYLVRRVRVTNGIGTEANSRWFKKIWCEAMAKWLPCVQRMILDINDMPFHPCL